MLGDITSVRSRFPALSRLTTDGQPCIFADAPGGTQVPQSVIDAISDYLANHNSNEHGAFATSRETDEVIAAAHSAAADLLGASPDEVVFGQNATTHLFAISRAVARDLRPGDEIVTTVLDHDANIAPWKAVAEDTGATLRSIDVRSDECNLDFADVAEAITPATRVVAFTLASNAVGTVTPAPAVVRRAREAGALVVMDAVHVAQHRALNVEVLDADILVTSAYKVFGPHIGVLYGRAEVLRSLRPYKARPADDNIPWAFETGTMNHEGMAGFVAAVDYLADVGRGFGTPHDDSRRAAVVAGMKTVREHEADLSSSFLEGLARIPRARLYGRPVVEDRTPTFAVTIEGRHSREVSEALGERGVFTWDGHYYALALMERLGLEPGGGAVRIGFCHYNTMEEVGRVLEVLGSLAHGGL